MTKNLLFLCMLTHLPLACMKDTTNTGNARSVFELTTIGKHRRTQSVNCAALEAGTCNLQNQDPDSPLLITAPSQDHHTAPVRHLAFARTASTLRAPKTDKKTTKTTLISGIKTVGILGIIAGIFYGGVYSINGTITKTVLPFQAHISGFQTDFNHVKDLATTMASSLNTMESNARTAINEVQPDLANVKANLQATLSDVASIKATVGTAQKELSGIQADLAEIKMLLNKLAPH